MTALTPPPKTPVSPKVTGATVAAAAATVVVWGVEEAFHVDIPGVAQAAIATLFAAAGGYLTRDPLRALGAAVARDRHDGRHEA